MRKNGSDTEKHCENCSKPLFGRTDKRFCNDLCRNTFNRTKTLREQQQAHDNLPEILKIIKRNYEILQSYRPQELAFNGSFWIAKSELSAKGYHFKFFTSSAKDNLFGHCDFCLDVGIKEIGDHYEIIYRPEQAEI